MPRYESRVFRGLLRPRPEARALTAALKGCTTQIPAHAAEPEPANHDDSTVEDVFDRLVGAGDDLVYNG